MPQDAFALKISDRNFVKYIYIDKALFIIFFVVEKSFTEPTYKFITFFCIVYFSYSFYLQFITFFYFVSRKKTKFEVKFGKIKIKKPVFTIFFFNFNRSLSFFLFYCFFFLIRQPFFSLFFLFFIPYFFFSSRAW